MIRCDKEWASLLVVRPRRNHELGRLVCAVVIGDLHDSFVGANVEVPGVAGLVATVRRVFHHDPLSGSVTQGQFVQALIRSSLHGVAAVVFQNARKFSALPAQRLRLVDRGLIKAGMWADVVIFDPATVRDLATFENPNQLSEGMEYVLVNGMPVVDQSKMTGALPGKIVRGPGYVP